MSAPALRPFFSYFGSKWRAALRYPQPEHDLIVEPFAGSAGYSLRHHDRSVLLVEAEPRVRAVWAFLLSASRADILGLPLLRAGEKVTDHESLSLGERALIGFWVSKASATPKVTMPSDAAWRGRRSMFWGEAIRQRIADQAPRIQHWVLGPDDFREAPDVQATWFIDPPYAEMGRHYPRSDVAQAELSSFRRSRSGLVICCGAKGDAWADFRPAFETKAMRGHSKEMVYVAASARPGEVRS